MAEQLRHVFHLLLLVSSLLFLSTAAQYSYDYEEGSPADAPSVSYISATPEASPVAAPSPDASYDDEEVDASSNQQELSLHTSNVLSSTQGEDDAFGASYGTMLAVDTRRSGHKGIAAAGRAGVNTFLHSMLVASVSKIDKFIENVILKRLKDPKVDSYTKECLETCKEVYEDSVGAMKKTMGDIQEGNFFKANVDVSAMSNDVDICKECVEQVIGGDREFDMFSKWLDVVTDKLLGKITGISS